ncbi:MAG TPA: hypothetical protein VNU68_31660 [Verrucomicrobiae bacterium]|nr:hypothetical protein [Verrucomicrobiae bacterium]
MNFLLPGSGLFWLGYRMLGACLSGAFLSCFLAIMTIFLIGYGRYLSIALSENLMEGNNLEQAGAAFHTNWLVGIAAVGLLLYAISAILFSRAKRRLTRS